MNQSNQINNLLARIESQAKFKRGGDLPELRRQLEDLGHDISVCLQLISKEDNRPFNDKRLTKLENVAF